MILPVIIRKYKTTSPMRNSSHVKLITPSDLKKKDYAGNQKNNCLSWVLICSLVIFLFEKTPKPVDCIYEIADTQPHEDVFA